MLWKRQYPRGFKTSHRPEETFAKDTSDKELLFKNIQRTLKSQS